MKGNFDRSLFSQEFVDKLEALQWLLKKKSEHGARSDRTVRKSGGNCDFQGYRHYSFGDDLRYIDWNVYARTSQLVVKQFSPEHNRHLLIVVDGSASMAIGDPPKYRLSLQIAAALCYLALANGYAIRLVIMAGDKITSSPYFYCRQEISAILYFLSWKRAGGIMRFDQVAASLLYLHRSLIVICSDLLAGETGKPVLQRLITRGNELAIFQFMAPEELRPPDLGPVYLQDAETGEQLQVVVTAETIDAYRNALHRFQDGWQAFCSRHRIHYFFSSTAPAMEEILLQGLARAGWLR